MKTWWPHYIWMKKNHLDFKSLAEHQEFNKISQRMSARQRVNDVQLSRQAIMVSRMLASQRIKEKREELKQV